ncbi:hypothetical protein BDR06DRAFT_303859 [Suillus hirtellus]|nr:hypothetical protein BDR06DRAFT_303859 [Suillus hirtellus]
MKSIYTHDWQTCTRSTWSHRSCQGISLQSIFRMIEDAAPEMTGYKRPQFCRVVSMDDTSYLQRRRHRLQPTRMKSSGGSFAVTVLLESDLTSRTVPIQPTPQLIVSQGVDYPGLAMAARPLQLYVLCIFICGHQFYLGR